MARTQCKTCRRAGTKLFLKGEKCLSSKCPLLKKAYPPGQRKKRRKGNLSEYGKELQEKQKLRNWYNLREKQFRKYIKEVLDARGKVEDAEAFLMEKLESRLDNVIFRLGFAQARNAARQMISHRHFLINGKVVNIPSYSVKIGDIISVNSKSRGKVIFKKLADILKRHNPPSWLAFDPEKNEGKVLSVPALDEMPPAEISSIFEFYSR